MFLATATFALLLCTAVTLGLGRPVAAWLRLNPAETLVAAVIISWTCVFTVAGSVYAFALPVVTLWTVPLLAGGAIFCGRESFTAALRDPTVCALLFAQLLVTAWCLGWLSLVASYSGGGWAADWVEHWERARFWVERGPLDQLFLGSYAVPARPPLINVVTGVFLALSRFDFAHYQIISTSLASLAFLPAALLAQRFGGPRAIPVLAVFFAVSPLFVQNATFPWTKLPAATCVLAALYFFLRAHDPSPPRAAPSLFATCLATGLLAHYSAGPAAVVLALAWLVLGWSRRRDPVWWRGTVGAVFVGALVLSTWFAWSLAHYGPAGTFLSNSSVQSPDTRSGSQLLKFLLNLRDTLIPHFLRPLDGTLIAQRNSWGSVRDWFFQIYQLNLPFAFGSVAVFALARELLLAARAAALRARVGWALALVSLVLLSVAVQGERDTWGLTHICLQSLVLLGLAFLAARWTTLGRKWRIALIVGGAYDFIAGIALHFAAQSFELDRWFAPAGTDPTTTYTGYNGVALMNLAAKIQHRLAFVADLSPVPPALALALLAAIFALMLVRARATAK